MHQEDFCQCLGRPPSAKYEFNQTGVPGPTLSDMFDLTRRHLPPTDIVRLLDVVVFNVLVCNTDAHAKNYSIMLRGNGASLAPMALMFTAISCRREAALSDFASRPQVPLHCDRSISIVVAHGQWCSDMTENG
jgi:hypothetical protein